MTIEINGITYQPKFTFNSFKYMEDLDVSALENLKKTPFMIVPFVETLLMGALNSNPRTRVAMVDVDEYLEEYVKEGSLTELADELIKLLEESNFFKSIQKNPSKKKK